MADNFQPDFDAECRICGTVPCVIVVGHPHKPRTDLCGACFFDDPAMIDWLTWNDTDPGDNDES